MCLEKVPCLVSFPSCLMRGSPRGGTLGGDRRQVCFFLSPLHFDAFEGCVVVAQEVQAFSRIFFLSAIGRAECFGSVAQHHVLVNGEQSSEASF